MKKIVIVFFLLFLSSCATSNEELTKRFITNNGDGTVLDSETGLVWAGSASDNSVTWFEAVEYCENYSAAGYQDWRMPTQGELAALLKAGLRKNKEVIRINGDLIWADETDDTKGVYCSFRNNGCSWMEKVISISLCALPVRDPNAVETDSPATESNMVTHPQSTQQRLLLLDSLYKQKLITAEEYQAKKADVLNEL